MRHEVKTWPIFFDSVKRGDKTFELRRYDRPYRAGDTIVLIEWNMAGEHVTGNQLERRITCVLHNAEEFGLMPGFCILGLGPVEQGGGGAR
ncbi:MAG: DUF3850 domain-containing protein [Deltaproteobacteria bacterium]|nr:DUF3850 domain-containing protein [Deltaproteobacteria bacterium]